MLAEGHERLAKIHRAASIQLLNVAKHASFFKVNARLLSTTGVLGKS
jgi:hypothetical protein